MAITQNLKTQGEKIGCIIAFQNKIWGYLKKC